MKLKTVIKIYSPEDILNTVTGGTFSGPKIKSQIQTITNFCIWHFIQNIFSLDKNSSFLRQLYFLLIPITKSSSWHFF